MAHASWIFEGKFLEEPEDIVKAFEKLENEAKAKGWYDPVIRMTPMSRSCKYYPDEFSLEKEECPNQVIASLQVRYREFVPVCRGCLIEHIKKMSLYFYGLTR
jgi:hypothetical protein